MDPEDALMMEDVAADIDGLEGTVDSITGKKRERSNAKAVMLMDLAGNDIQMYRTGSLAATALNIAQGDISLCCRGLKFSAGNYRFKFNGEPEAGGVEDAVGEELLTDHLTRSTRKNRGEYGTAPALPEQVDPKNIVRSVKDIKVRRWQYCTVKIGNLLVDKWVPLVAGQKPNPALRNLMNRNIDGSTKVKKGKAKKTKPNQVPNGRFSLGSMAQED